MLEIYEKCPNCGWFPEHPEDDKQLWEYTPTSYKNRNDALKKCEIRMKNDMGYGIPELGRNDETEKR